MTKALYYKGTLHISAVWLKPLLYAAKKIVHNIYCLNPDMALIVIAYLGFMKTTFSSFKVKILSCKEWHSDCL